MKGHERIRAALAAGKSLVTDGGTGAELARRGWAGSSALATSDAPELVGEIHHAFRAAGADLIVANTFLAAGHVAGAADPSELLRNATAAVELARKAFEPSPERPFVAASLGPTGLDAGDRERLAGCYRPLIAAVGGADALFVETMLSLADAEAALAAARLLFAGPVFVTFALDAYGRGYGGETVDTIAAWARRDSPDAVGLNCGEGSRSVLLAGRALKERLPDLPLVLRPAAGGPPSAGPSAFRQAPDSSLGAALPLHPPPVLERPDRFGDFAREARSLGARVIGGCCGAGPDHIRAIAGVAKESRIG